MIFPQRSLISLACPFRRSIKAFRLTPFVDGETPNDWRTDFYCEHHSGNAKLPRWFGVRDDRYTYANYYKNGVELLYDRKVDPTELVNVGKDPKYSDTLKRLREKAMKYKAEYSRQ